ncbi:MAG TPA: hypothetical protein VK473_07020 [Terriglobales bacterium]|nr:hypothetical protein [Terriglobales bacterium]
MKSVRFAFLLTVLAFSCVALAQYAGMGQGTGGGRGGHGGWQMPSVDDQVKNLTQELSLSDDQQSQVRSILQDQQNQMKQLMQDTSTSREDKMAKMKGIHQSATGKIRDLLNDDQKKKYDDYLEKRQQQFQQRRGSMGGPQGS